MMRRWWLAGAAFALALAGAPAIAGSQALAAAAPGHGARDHATGALAGAAQGAPKVLLVCNGSTKPCPPGASIFSTVQGAVNAPSPGDWIVIWPGVYHEKTTRGPTAGGRVPKPNLHTPA